MTSRRTHRLHDHFSLIRAQLDAKGKEEAGKNSPPLLPKCPFVAGFIIFGFCLPVMALIVWLVCRGFGLVS